MILFVSLSLLVMIILRFTGKPFEQQDDLLSDNCRERERVGGGKEREGGRKRERGAREREREREEGGGERGEREKVIFSPLTQRQGRFRLDILESVMECTPFSPTN